MTVTTTSYGNHLRDILSFYGSLLDNQGFSGLIIPSGAPKQQFLDDSFYPFKVNVHFKALLPLVDAPNSYIIYRPGAKPVLALYQPEDYWHVVPSDPEGVWVDYFEIKLMRGKDDWQRLLPERRRNLVWLGEPQPELETLRVICVNPEQLLSPIHYNRAYKSAYEVSCLREASLIAAKGHLAAKKVFDGGGSELEIHLAYLHASLQKEQQLPYENIVALNHHGAVLHYSTLDKQPPSQTEQHSLLLDAGATFNGYCSDITRTWSSDDGEFNDLIQAMDQLQLELVSELSVGRSYVDVHLSAHLKIAKLLKDAGFIYCDQETAMETGISSTFFPHGLGHLLGLQVHDIGGHQATASGDIALPPENHPFLRLTKMLESGFCLTIEPGIYFIDLLLSKLAISEHAALINWPKVEAFKQYGGIRIEDDVIISDAGTENITRNAFAQLSSNTSTG